MQCNDAQRAILTGFAQRNASADNAAVTEHLGTCAACSFFYSEQLLQRQLQAADIPPHSADFVDRAIAQAIQRGRSQRRARMYWVATAATLTGAVALLLNQTDSTEPAPAARSPQFALVPHEVHPVRLVIHSTADRDDATVSIELAENLELDGYPNRHQLSWKTDLQKGKNLLSLPLVLQDTANSYVKITYSYGAVQKQVDVMIRPTDATSNKKPLG